MRVVSTGKYKRFVIGLIFSVVFIIIGIMVFASSRETSAKHYLSDYIDDQDSVNSVTVTYQGDSSTITTMKPGELSELLILLETFALNDAKEFPPNTRKYTAPGIDFTIELKSHVSQSQITFLSCDNNKAIIMITCSDNSIKTLVVGNFIEQYNVMKQFVMGLSDKAK